jgi:hypothetical protein
MLPSKDCVATEITRIQAVAERKSGNVLGTLRTNHGGEFSTGQFKKYCQELGVRRELTAPYTPAKWCSRTSKSDNHGGSQMYA